MHHDSDSEQAKDQLQSSILGNWREGVVAMGGDYVPWWLGK